MTVLFTRRDYEKLPEGMPVELHDGLLVKQPSPRWGHQRIQFKILRRLAELVEAGQLDDDRVAAGPVDVLIDELNVFVPDIVVLDDIPPDDAQYVGVPALAIEILSPSTRGRDRDFKAARMLGLGVKEVWLIDAQRCSIEVRTVNGGREAVGEDIARSDVVTGFELVPATLFAPPRGS